MIDLRPSMDILAKKVHATAREKGFWDHEFVDTDTDGYPIDNPSIVPEKLALIMSEVAEVLEAHRDDNLFGMEEELADVIIRVLDLAEFYGFSMDDAIAEKMISNRARPHLHGRIR